MTADLWGVWADSDVRRRFRPPLTPPNSGGEGGAFRSKCAKFAPKERKNVFQEEKSTILLNVRFF